MSDAVATPNESNQDGNTGGPTSTASDEFKPITSQDDLNKVISDRIARERAKFSDYEDVKAKASKFDELAEANKTEVEKANDLAAQARAEVEALPSKVADALRTHLVELHKIDADRAALYLTASDPDLLIKQVAGLVDLDADRKKNNAHVPNEGNAHVASGSSERDLARELFGG